MKRALLILAAALAIGAEFAACHDVGVGAREQERAAIEQAGEAP